MSKGMGASHSVRAVGAFGVVMMLAGCGVLAGTPILSDEELSAADGGEDSASGTADSGSTTGGPPTRITQTGGVDMSGPPFFLEAELAIITGPGEIGQDAAASNGEYAAVPGGGGRHDGGIAFALDLQQSANVDLWARVHTPNAGRDSFRLYLDDEEVRDPWHVGQHLDWTWVNAASLSLSSGTHVLEFRFREAGAQLDIIGLLDPEAEPEFPEPEG